MVSSLQYERIRPRKKGDEVYVRQLDPLTPYKVGVVDYINADETGGLNLITTNIILSSS